MCDVILLLFFVVLISHLFRFVFVSVFSSIIILGWMKRISKVALKNKWRFRHRLVIFLWGGGKIYEVEIDEGKLEKALSVTHLGCCGSLRVFSFSGPLLCSNRLLPGQCSMLIYFKKFCLSIHTKPIRVDYEKMNSVEQYTISRLLRKRKIN